MKEPYDYDKQDPTFIPDLRKSRIAVRKVAHWLSEQGYPVVIRPTFERPDPSEMADYSDDGDLEIMQSVEVKCRQTLTFTSREDFPYPTLIIDTCSAYDRKKPKPYKYVILNREMTAAFVVNCRDTFSQWTRVAKRDRLKNRTRDFYECPINVLQFVRIEVGEEQRPPALAQEKPNE